MIERGTRIQIRNQKDFDMKVIGKGQLIGEVEEISWAPMKDTDETEAGLVCIGISFKIKKDGLSIKCKAVPKDILTLAIQGKPTSQKFARISENVQSMKFVPVKIMVDDKETTQPIPEEFEEEKLYSYKGYMLITE